MSEKNKKTAPQALFYRMERIRACRPADAEVL
jgi:hypothetical protein